ncbi:MAG: hypothetical protein ACRDJE_24770 [Dehalococcoidia bacterium]
MTNAQTSTLVLKDQAGTYFLVSQETLERGRVPEEQVAELEQAIAAAQGGAGGDVQGFILPLVYGIAMTVGFAAGYFGTRAAIEEEEVLVPDLSSAMSSSASHPIH